MPDRSTGTVTLLFTDTEGSTRLWQDDVEIRGGELCTLPMDDVARLIPRAEPVDIPQVR